MQLHSLVGHLSEIYRIINKSNQPPDKLTSEYLRSKKYLGSNDRRFISEYLFNILRIKSLPDSIYHQIISESDIIPTDIAKEHEEFIICSFGIITCNFLDFKNVSFDKNINENYQELANGLEKRTGLSPESSKSLLDMFANKVRIYKSLDFESLLINGKHDETGIFFGQQPWLVAIMMKSRKYSANELLELFRSFLQPSPLMLRINAHHSMRKDILNQLKQFDPDCIASKYSPWGVKMSKRIDLNTVPYFKSGVFEVQDEGSQLISVALTPDEDEHILDACAGAGGKSIHIATITSNKSHITATDMIPAKLRELTIRAKRTGLNSITTISLKDLKSKRRTYDKVLIDAPCTGMGTIRRNPMQKWKLTPELLEKYNTKQKSILAEYSQFLKPGGILVYSTCSVLFEENEAIVNDFLSNHPDFETDCLKPAFDNYGINLPGLEENDFDYQILPSVHGCDGFYFARLKRIHG